MSHFPSSNSIKTNGSLTANASESGCCIAPAAVTTSWGGEMEVEPSPLMRNARIGLICFGVIWIVGLAVGFALMDEHTFAPGDSADPPQQWPAEAPFPRVAGQPTFLLFLHPRCPCSRASLEEFGQVLEKCQTLPTAHIVFHKPPGVEIDWEQTAYWRLADQIPNAKLWTDDGTECRRFRAKTSGQAMIYSPEGELRFTGGLTVARGHSGANLASESAIDLMEVNFLPRMTCPVYGCRLTAEIKSQEEKQRESVR